MTEVEQPFEQLCLNALYKKFWSSLIAQQKYYLKIQKTVNKLKQRLY